MNELLITMAVATLIESVKNPANKEKLRKAMLKVYRTIKTVYAGDPDFE